MTDDELRKVANEVRKGIVVGTHAAKSGHPGGSLSAADILTYLYFEEMNIDPKDPAKADRDRLVLSKGHAAPGLYAVLAERGYFPKEDLETLRHIGSHLQGHPNMNDTPGVDMSTGSLGQGVSAAVGMALASKVWNDGYRVFAILGDGEIEEGQVWEAAMFAGNHQLDNLCRGRGPQRPADRRHHRGGQLRDAHRRQVPRLQVPRDRACRRQRHGVRSAQPSPQAREVTGQPVCIVAETVKGKGVSFMENEVDWHGKGPNDDQYEQALAELESAGKEL